MEKSICFLSASYGGPIKGRRKKSTQFEWVRALKIIEAINNLSNLFVEYI